jgi:hypothetical protein
MLWQIPIVHAGYIQASCPDLVRASTERAWAVPLSVDGWDKLGHDEQLNRAYAPEQPRAAIW